MNSIKHKALLVLLGGASFWGPVTLVELLTSEELNLAAATLGPPTTLLLCYFFLRRHLAFAARPISLWMLLGVYMLGTWFMFIAFTKGGGGFSQPLGWVGVWMLFLSMVIPFITLMFSGYHGTFFGLLATTLIMFVIRATMENIVKDSSL